MKIKLPLYFIERNPETGEEKKGILIDAILEIIPEEITLICPYLDKDFQVTEMTEIGMYNGRIYVINVHCGEFVKFYQDTFGDKFKELKPSKKKEE